MIRPRDRLVALMGMEVVRFQDESAAFDDIAAQILALDRADLPCMTLLLFGGSASIDHLTRALHTSRAAVTVTVGRLQLAGYARRQPAAGDGDGAARIELTEHARDWIERIWAPLRVDGGRLLASYSTHDLTMMSAFMVRARAVQHRQLRKLRRWLARPATPTRHPHLRGGLSPAALRRVQLFVEANLDQAIQLEDLAARAGLSRFHFARAFKRSAGITPRAFVEARRIDRARDLIQASDQPLVDVALATGFGTQSRMTTTFRRQTGFTPAQYRRGGGATGGQR